MRLHIEYSKHSFLIMFDPHHVYYPKKKKTTRKAQIIQKRALPYAPTPLSLQQLKQAYEYFQRNGYDTVQQPKQYSKLYNNIETIVNLTIQPNDSTTVTFFDIYDSMLKEHFQFVPDTVKSFEVLFYIQQIEAVTSGSPNFTYNIVNRASLPLTVSGSVELDSYTQRLYQVRTVNSKYNQSYLTEQPYIWLQQYYTNNISDYTKFKNPTEETFPQKPLINITNESQSLNTINSLSFFIMIRVSYTY